MCSALLKSNGIPIHGLFEASVALPGLGRAGRMHTLQIDIYPECTEVGADPDCPIPSSGQAWPSLLSPEFLSLDKLLHFTKYGFSFLQNDRLHLLKVVGFT